MQTMIELGAAAKPFVFALMTLGSLLAFLLLGEVGSPQLLQLLLNFTSNSRHSIAEDHEGRSPSN